MDGVLESRRSGGGDIIVVYEDPEGVAVSTPDDCWAAEGESLGGIGWEICVVGDGR